MVVTMINPRMTKFFEELHQAEFGNDENEIKEDPKEFIRLLEGALKCESDDNLLLICEYLGVEDDDRLESPEGVREIISETIEIQRRRL